MEKNNLEENNPPILGSWNNMYAFVIGFGLLQILIFSFLTYIYK
jgi:hypothetical protein